jgi:arsenate reductase
LLEEKIRFDSRDLGKQRLSESELDRLIGDHDYKDFLNPWNELFRKRKMKEHPPSRAEAIKLMAKEPNLIRRPLLVHGSRIIFGFDEAAYHKIAST